MKFLANRQRLTQGSAPSLLHLEKEGLLQLPEPCKRHLAGGILEHIHIERQKFFADALFFLRCNNIRGDYFEFGTYQAWTFRQVMLLAKSMELSDMKFYGFDSFEGFPQLQDDDYSAAYGGFRDEAGSRAMSEQDFYALIGHSVPELQERVHTSKGFYDQSLTPALAERLAKDGKDVHASLVTVDCDLYESAKPVFTFIEGFLAQGSVVYIDDYWVGYRGSEREGVARAFREYRAESRFDFADWGRVGGWGHAFIAQSR